MKSVIINADDLGLSEAVNRAIVDLAEAKRLQSTSFMSLGRVSHSDIQRLQQHSVDIGLHFDLTSILIKEYPQSASYMLSGSLKNVLWNTWMRRFPKHLVRQAVVQQLDAFEEKVGQTPVFIDGHQHIHQFPQIREALLHESDKRYGIHTMCWRSTAPTMPDCKSYIIAQLGGQTLRRRLIADKRICNDFFAGVYDFKGGQAALIKYWKYWLQQIPKDRCTVIMCHPAVPDDSWQDDIRVARECEFNYLMGSEFATLYQQSNVVPAYWHDFFYH